MLIPYFEAPEGMTVLGVQVSAAGVLLLASVLAAYAVMVRRGRVIDGRAAEKLAQVVLAAGVSGAHVGGVVAAHGAGAIGRPGLWAAGGAGLSSVGGMVAAGVAGGVYLRWVRRASGAEARAWADVAAVAFAVGLVFARAGCAVAHDHPGRLWSGWLAVRFPGGPRVDCGLMEGLAAPVLVGLSVGVSRWGARSAGAVAGVVGASYAVARFFLDFLRAEDLPGADWRWVGLTIAQWMALPLFVTCVWLLGASRGGSR